MNEGTGRRKRRLMGEINVVPYIDVMLVLLIIFMITAPLLTQGIKVDLPDAGAEPLPPDPDQLTPLILNVDAEGRLYLNVGSDPESPIDIETARERIAAVLRREPRTPVMVGADRVARFEQVVDAMVLLQQTGASKVGVLTDPLPPDQAPVVR
ncbi:MAG TPA: ExbD/TolR family protein [Steroidobacteraceae bacterium]|nr:ExbD/TolR family protein [Steroidobacteraceae bacterium]